MAPGMAFFPATQAMVYVVQFGRSKGFHVTIIDEVIIPTDCIYVML